MICWKIRIFAYWTTPLVRIRGNAEELWFAEKFVSLLIEQHRLRTRPQWQLVVICWKIRIFAYWTTPLRTEGISLAKLWFAEKFVSLLIEQHQTTRPDDVEMCCDLLKNSYLCLLNNTARARRPCAAMVVICWKIRIFAYWTTPNLATEPDYPKLWFAEKFVSLLIEQHLIRESFLRPISCDLLKNSYLCLLNNTEPADEERLRIVVICWKIRIFAYWTTPATGSQTNREMLWFAEKFVSLLIEQHQKHFSKFIHSSCDLLKNSYLCLLNNTRSTGRERSGVVVICWKIRIFAYWTTPFLPILLLQAQLWFAEKFVSLLIEQHHL